MLEEMFFISVAWKLQMHQGWEHSLTGGLPGCVPRLLSRSQTETLPRVSVTGKCFLNTLGVLSSRILGVALFHFSRRQAEMESQGATAFLKRSFLINCFLKRQELVGPTPLFLVSWESLLFLVVSGPIFSYQDQPRQVLFHSNKFAQKSRHGCVAGGCVYFKTFCSSWLCHFSEISGLPKPTWPFACYKVLISSIGGKAQCEIKLPLAPSAAQHYFCTGRTKGNKQRGKNSQV